MEIITVSVIGDGVNVPYTPVVDAGYSWRVIGYNEDYTSAEVEIWEGQLPPE